MFRPQSSSQSSLVKKPSEAILCLKVREERGEGRARACNIPQFCLVGAQAVGGRERDLDNIIHSTVQAAKTEFFFAFFSDINVAFLTSPVSTVIIHHRFHCNWHSGFGAVIARPNVSLNILTGRQGSSSVTWTFLLSLCFCNHF